MLLNFLYEIRKVFNRLLAKILHCIEAEHAVTLELRFGEKLVSGALVRKSFAPLKVFVNVARFITVTRWLYVNNYAFGRYFPFTSVHCRADDRWRCSLSGRHVSTRDCAAG